RRWDKLEAVPAQALDHAGRLLRHQDVADDPRKRTVARAPNLSAYRIDGKKVFLRRHDVDVLRVHVQLQRARLPLRVDGIDQGQVFGAREDPAGPWSITIRI